MMGKSAGGTGRQASLCTLRLGGFIPRSSVNGPGIRAVLWAQGCPLRCKGCFNRDLWQFGGGHNISVDELFAEIKGISGIDGVTFSGGEPFSQAWPLAALASKVHGEGLTVVTFTGFSYSSLITKERPSWRQLLQETDLLVAGPYRSDLRCVHPLLASSNQELLALTGRISLPSPREGETAGTVEYTISRQGIVHATGFPGPDLCHKVSSLCGRGGG